MNVYTRGKQQIQLYCVFLLLFPFLLLKLIIKLFNRFHQQKHWMLVRLSSSHPLPHKTNTAKQYKTRENIT